MILGAAYMLWLVQRLFYGPESALAASKPSADLRFGELAVLTPLVVLMLVMGLAPNLWLNTIQTGVHPPPLKSATSQNTQNPAVILSDRSAAQGVEGSVTPTVILSEGRPRQPAAVEGPAFAFSRTPGRPASPPHAEAQR